MTQRFTFDEVPPIRKSLLDAHSLQILRNIRMYCYKFDDEDVVTKFANIVLPSHGETGRSPFILGSIRVHEPEVDPFEGQRFYDPVVYWQKLEAVLGKLGRHIREFSFFIPSQSTLDDDDDVVAEAEYPDFHNFSTRLIQCLESLGNVTYLKVGGNIVIQEKLTNQQRKQFRDMTIIPKCEKLTMIHLLDLKDPSFVLQRCLVTLHAEQLTRLCFRISDDAYSWSVPTDMPSLKELYIQVESIKMVETFTSQLRASRHPPKLIRFGLKLFEAPLQNGALDRLCQLYNKFGNTLQALVMDVDVALRRLQICASQKYDIRVKLDCPLLKSVDFSFFSSLSLNFLQNFADTLEDLRLQVKGEETPRDGAYVGEIVDLYDHLGTMTWSKSNIWKVFPRLHVVRLDYSDPQKLFAVEGRTFRNEKKTSTTKRYFNRVEGFSFWDSDEDGDTDSLFVDSSSSDEATTGMWDDIGGSRGD